MGSEIGLALDSPYKEFGRCRRKSVGWKPVDMSDASKTAVLTRAAILQFLSAGEVASVGSAEAATHLRRGDEYLDLENLQRGVQRADGTKTSVEDLLPHKAVHEDTWRRIVRHVNAARP